MSLRTSLIVLTISGAVGMATQVSAQAPGPKQFDVASEVTTLGVNSLLGGVTAATGALIRGEQPWRAFAHGLAGGTIIYSAKRIATGEWFGAGLAARQVGLFGGSLVSNAAAGRDGFGGVPFALGPVRGHVAVHGEMSWKLDVPALFAVIWGALDSESVLDIGKSISSGAIVFESDGSHSLPGTIFYLQTPSNPERETYVLAHERIHVLQFDQTFTLWGDPFERWTARRVPALSPALDKLDFNFIGLVSVTTGLFLWPEHNRQPWEREAMYLAGSRSSFP